MQNRRVRIGILGCAKIARRSMAPAILALGDAFQLVAVASRDADKAKTFAAEFRCEAVVGYDALIERNDIDALYVPLPTGMHREWVGKAVESGKHVYAEKSFAATSDDASTLTALAQQRGVAVMEGYMFLYHRQQAEVARLLAEGAIGELRHFHGSFGFPPLPDDDFRYDEVLGGGVLMDAAGYPLRAAQLFLGDNLEVQGAAVHRGRDTTLWGSAFLRRPDGVGASIAFGFDNFYQCRYELWGSGGKLVAERAYTPGPTFTPRLVIETAGGAREILVDADNHFLAAMRTFHDAIMHPEHRVPLRQAIERQSLALTRIRQLAFGQ